MAYFDCFFDDGVREDEQVPPMWRFKCIKSGAWGDSLITPKMAALEPLTAYLIGCWMAEQCVDDFLERAEG